MKRTLLGILVIGASAACAETAAEPAVTDTQALVATASEWTPRAIVRNLQVDGATRQRIEDGLAGMHTSMLELHARVERVETLAGAARETYEAELRADMQVLHEQHIALWESLDPEVRAALTAQLHEHMDRHDDDSRMKKLHEHMRRMHGGR